MPEPLKNMYNPTSLKKLALNIQSAYSPFQTDEFLASTLDETWNSLELKARCRKITTSLRKYLPNDYREAIDVINRAIITFGSYGSWTENDCMFFPDFVEMYGQNEENWDISIDAMARYTPYATAEFAVRPFLINHEERMMAQMYAWAKHENEHVRRLASEGCRPALPWAQALPKYKQDPAPILPILAQLKNDPSLYVRRSVANNMNDISKTHPDLVAKLAKEWYGDNEHTNWIVKHACRTLLKQGNTDVLALFGFHNVTSVNVDDFALASTSVLLGEDITFSFAISAKEAAKTRLEYAIGYMKANGKQRRKIFQISEVQLKANEKKLYSKNHSFADVSVRKHYPGIHSITLIVNGAEQGTLDFELCTSN